MLFGPLGSTALPLMMNPIIVAAQSGVILGVFSTEPSPKVFIHHLTRITWGLILTGRWLNMCYLYTKDLLM